MEKISVPKDLFEALIDNSWDLLSELSYWENEPRLGRAEAYKRIKNEIKLAESLLNNEKYES